MKFLFEPGKREIEKPGLYNDQKEVDAFVNISKGGIVGFFENSFANMILERFKPDPPLRVLDLGTGPGWVPAKLAKARPEWNITGLDASPPMLTHLQNYAQKNQVRVQTVESKAEHTPFPQNHFDLIISHLAFSEFPNGEAVVHEIERILKPGGTFIIDDISRPPRWMMPLLVAARYITNPFGRLNHQYVESLRGALTAKELEALFQKSNLIFKVKYFDKWVGGHLRVSGSKRIA
jgi:ubiquinone/menaquinone biosynthesis C-methylase UbiE